MDITRRHHYFEKFFQGAFTLLDILLYQNVFVRTRLKQQWPEMQAWTVVEWGKRRGVHLHAVVKGTPGLTAEWLYHVVGLLHDETAIHIGYACLHSTDQLARYLTKQHADPRQATGWPRGFHPFSATRGWCPDWLSRQEWAARQRDR